MIEFFVRHRAKLCGLSLFLAGANLAPHVEWLFSSTMFGLPRWVLGAQHLWVAFMFRPHGIFGAVEPPKSLAVEPEEGGK